MCVCHCVYMRVQVQKDRSQIRYPIFLFWNPLKIKDINYSQKKKKNRILSSRGEKN